MSPGLGVYWDDEEVGRLEQVDERSRQYVFRYTQSTRSISLGLPVSHERFETSESRPFFEALLPEGAVREQIARQLRVAPGDSYGLLAALGGDCAGALQILDAERTPQRPSVRWLDAHGLDRLIEELPRHPLGIRAEDDHLRLSLAGVQHKAVLVREGNGRFGEPRDGMPSSHILKPELPHSDYPGLVANEYFCMRLAARCGLRAAAVEVITAAGRPCLVVERYDREQVTSPHRRIHQEDLCQALGLTPDFKYQREGWRLPSYRALAELLDKHSAQPGLDRLAGAQAALLHFLVGNADAHAKNISLLHVHGKVRLAPLYDVVSTAVYPALSTELSLGVGDELNPDTITSIHWSDLADDFGLSPGAYVRVRRALVERVASEAPLLQAQARAEGWYHPCIDAILDIIAARSQRST